MGCREEGVEAYKELMEDVPLDGVEAYKELTEDGSGPVGCRWSGRVRPRIRRNEEGKKQIVLRMKFCSR